MFDDENVLNWCIENNISVTQYTFMFFLMERGFNDPTSRAVRYIKKFGVFDRKEVDDLIERGFIEDFNSPGKNQAEFYIIKDEVIAIIKATDDDAEELWMACPPTFETTNFHFTARQGGILGDKETTKTTYLRKIKRSKKKHKFVMEMWKKYLQLVENRKMNSMKLVKWIANKMRDTVDETDEQQDYGIEVR